MDKGMQLLWLVCSLALAARSRAANTEEDVQPLRCYTCGGDGEGLCNTTGGAGAPESKGHATLCPRDRPHCATRASSPNFTSVLSCSVAAERACSLIYSVKGTYEMTCVCSAQLCNAPFSHRMQTELTNFATFNSANNGTQLNEVFWKLSHLANGNEPNVYKKITEEIRVITEATVWVSSKLTTTTKTIAGSTLTAGGKLQQRVVTAEAPRAHALRQAEEPRAQASRQPTPAPSDDDEDEDEGSGADDESPARRPPASAPAAPSSFLPADGSGAPPPFVNFFTITALLVYTIM